MTDRDGVNFTCVATAFPRPNISWFLTRNSITNRIMEESNLEERTGERQLMSTLTVTSVMPSLAGTYTCNASNVVSDTAESAELTVYSGFEINITL